MELDDVIRARKSVRKFKSRKPSWRDIIEAINYASKIPYAGNIHNVKFILIDDRKTINELGKYCQHDFVSRAHYVIVVTSDTTDLIRSYDVKGEKYSLEQGGAAVSQLLLKLVDLGLDGCWIGAFDEDHVKLILKIPDNVEVSAIVPVGYGMDTSGRKRKPRIDRVLRFNDYKKKVMKPRDEPEAF